MKTFLTLLAMLATSIGFSFVQSTSFEANPAEVPGWDSTNVQNEFAINTWVGQNLNSFPGWNVQSAGAPQNAQVFTGNQSCEFKFTSNTGNNYTAGPNWQPFSTKYLRARSKVYIVGADTDNEKGFGLQGDTAGWRILLVKNSLGSWELRGFNAKTFQYSVLASGLTNIADTWHELELEVDLNNKLVRGWFDGTEYVIASNVNFQSFDSIVNISLISWAGAINRGHAYFDDYMLTDQPRAVVFPPNSFTVNLGQVASGDLSSLQSTDGNALRVCKFFVPNATVPPVNVSVGANVGSMSVSKLQFAVNAKMVTGGSFSITVDLFDWTNNAYDPTDVASQVISTAYVLTEASSTGSALRYVDGTGNLKGRYRIQRTGFTAVATWCSECDQAYFTVEN